MDKISGNCLRERSWSVVNADKQPVEVLEPAASSDAPSEEEAWVPRYSKCVLHTATGILPKLSVLKIYSSLYLLFLSNDTPYI